GSLRFPSGLDHQESQPDQAGVLADRRLRSFRSTRNVVGDPGHGRRHQVGGGSLTLRAVRVVPNVPSFSVDGGFWYSVPESIEVVVGSQVRVPLSGRRVRGWVVEVG